jgi:hypothetical protein
MQIFWLDKNPEQCAKYYCDSHVNKILLEITQMICTNLNESDEFPSDKYSNLYDSTHKNNEVVKWVGESIENFLLTYELALRLNKEYKYRFDKNENHKSWDVLNTIDHSDAFPIFDKHDFTLPPLNMDDEFKLNDGEDFDEVVESYRSYYRRDKNEFKDGSEPTWTNRQRPTWFFKS